MDWGAWTRERKRICRDDPRVQAIRCLGCHRLRAHPDRGGMHCACGGVSFVETFPHPDEEQIALKLYAKEIEERNLYGRLAQGLLEDFEHG